MAGDRPAELIKRLTEEPFDITKEWPIRAGVIADGDAVRRMRMVFNHLSLDDVSLGTLTAELDVVLAARIARRPIQLPPVVHQPVDLARHEATLDPAQSLDHWRRIAARLPKDIYAGRRTGAGSPSSPPPSRCRRYWPRPGRSPASTRSGRRRCTSPRTRSLSPPTRASRGSRSGCTPASGNPSGYENVLGCASYPTLVVIDTAGTFVEVLKAAAARVEEAMAYAHVPYDLVIELVAQAGEPRVESELNFLNYAPRSCRARRDRFVWNAEPVSWAKSGADTYFRIYELVRRHDAGVAGHGRRDGP